MIVLYDGDCGFCNKSVQFIIKNDTKNVFRFAALQSDFSRRILEKNNLSTVQFDTIILIKQEKLFIKSEAFFEIIKEFQNCYRWLFIFKVFPIKLCNVVYDIISANRHRLAENVVCEIPDVKTREKFIS